MVTLKRSYLHDYVIGNSEFCTAGRHDRVLGFEKVTCGVGRFYTVSNWGPSEASNQEETELCSWVNAFVWILAPKARMKVSFSYCCIVAVRHTSGEEPNKVCFDFGPR